MSSEIYDFIIVGAGSSGCVLANRLSADGSKRVLLLEAGGEDSSLLIGIPKGIARLLLNPRYCWRLRVEQAKAPGLPARDAWVGGKVLGGSSAINGMIYSRGHPQDYAEWERRAGADWGWPALREAYRQIEDHDLGADQERGAGGPLHVSSGKFRYPLAEKLIQAGEQMGLRRKEDLNRADLDGVGYYCHTIRNGRRVSAADAFLRPVQARANLTVMTGVQVDRVTFAGHRVTGVSGRRGDQQVSFASRGEVILCAGVMLSPKILQLSGIGPAALLQSVGVPVMVDSPAVGCHLRDHLGFRMQYRLKGDKGINHCFHGVGLWRSVLQYLLLRSGPLATGPYEVGAFVRAVATAGRPDTQLFLAGLTLAYAADNTHALPKQGVEDAPGLGIYVQPMNLTSEGALAIKATDAAAPLAIRPNYLLTEHDCRLAVAAMRYVRRYLRQPAIAAHVGEETLPGSRYETDADILDVFRRQSFPGLHAVGTCRMGRERDAVVDQRLRVRGVDGLRVVDCSVMPSLVSGNTSGPAMALGWRAADLILADARQG